MMGSLGDLLKLMEKDYTAIDLDEITDNLSLADILDSLDVALFHVKDERSTTPKQLYSSILKEV